RKESVHPLIEVFRNVPSTSNLRYFAPRPRYGNARGRTMAPDLRWVDGSSLLLVEPRLIGNLDVVSVGVADVCREVVGTPFGPKARFLVGSSSRVHRRLVAGPYGVRALGCECDVKIFRDFAILQPE